MSLAETALPMLSVSQPAGSSEPGGKIVLNLNRRFNREYSSPVPEKETELYMEIENARTSLDISQGLSRSNLGNSTFAFYWELEMSGQISRLASM